MLLFLEGFSLITVSIISENLCCVLCTNILENPHQAPCGCRFCFDCIRNYLKDNERICPGKTEDCFEEKLNIERNLRLDIRAKREISKVIVKCPLYLCEQECDLRDMKNHLTECTTSTIICSKCNKSITRTEFENHKGNECNESILECGICHLLLTREKLQIKHFNYEDESLCCLYTDYCPNVCGEKEKVLWINHRIRCKPKYVECPYRIFGCVSDKLSLKMITLHMKDKCYDHSESLLKQFFDTKKENEVIRNNINKSYKEMLTFKDRVYEKEKEITNLNNKIITINNEIENATNDFSKSLITKKDVQNELTTLEINEMNKEIIKIKEDLEIIQNQFKKLTSKEEESEILYEKNEIKKFKKPRENKNELSWNVGSKEIVFTWNVYNFTRICDICSPYFYTSSRGYKLSLQLKTTNPGGYLSSYVWLYPGEYDNELSWPFRKCVTLRILDQIKGYRYYQKSIPFDKNAGSVCKQSYSLNGAYFGISDFILVQTLYERPYLLYNDELYIQCLVEDLKEV